MQDGRHIYKDAKLLVVKDILEDVNMKTRKVKFKNDPFWKNVEQGDVEILKYAKAHKLEWVYYQIEANSQFVLTIIKAP